MGWILRSEVNLLRDYVFGQNVSIKEYKVENEILINRFLNNS